MRVLIVIDSLSFGGAESTLVTLARYAPGIDLRLDVAVVGPPTTERTQWLPALQAAGLDPQFLGITKLRQPNAIRTVARAVRRSGCDVIHAHLGAASTLAPIAGRLSGRPAVCTLHLLSQPGPGREAIRERLSVATASRSAGLIFVSQASMASFAARYRPNPKTWMVIPNGVDLERFYPDDEARLPADLPIPPEAPVVTVAGHMRPGKGHDVAVEAWPGVLASHPDARLLLVGSGPEENALRQRVAGLDLAERVIFAGIRNDVADVLRASTFALLPSSTEALPTVLIEAAACGRPAAATRVGGVPEVVVDGETGCLFDRPAPEAVTDTVVGMLADRQRVEVMGRAARCRAVRVFDATPWAATLRSTYERVVHD